MIFFVISESSITYMVLYSIYLSVLSLSILYSVFFFNLLKLWNVSVLNTVRSVELRTEGTRAVKREPTRASS